MGSRGARSRRRVRALIGLLLAVAVAANVLPVTGMATVSAAGYSARVDALVAAMTLEEKVGQLFVSHVYGDEANERDGGPVGKNRTELGVDNAVQLIERYKVGGIIYFGWAGNVRTPVAAARLSNGIQATAMAQPRQVPMLISTDQEGGTVARLRGTVFAGNMAIGATRRADLARAAARVMGRELRAVGIMQTLAPVADVNINPANPVIGVRSYGSRAGLVSDMTAAQVLGFQVDGGVAATAKHFPGHGDTDVDSHSGLPVINISRDQWLADHAPPFVAAIAAGSEAIMTAHVAVPALDPSGRPATLSAPILTGVLRGELGFDGVIITDSLGMAGVQRIYGNERVPVLALLAGADMLLNPPRIAVAYRAVVDAVRSGELTEARIDQSVRRILRLKERLGLFGSQAVDLTAVDKIVRSRAHRSVERQVAEASVTLVRNSGALLPLRTTSGRVLVTGWGSAALLNLEAALSGRGVSSTRFLTGQSPGSETISEAVRRALNHDVVVVVTANADVNANQRTLVERLVATGRPVITVAVRRPYDAAWYDSRLHLCLYSWSAPSMRAAVRAIYGDIGPQGKLPVDVHRPGRPVVHPFGFGLAY